MKNKVVVALGGNALTKKEEKGTVEELKENIRITCKNLIHLVKNNKLVIVSGSGPQIGNILLQNELSKSKVPPMPLDVLDAELEGELGYLIQQNLLNELRSHNLKYSIATLLTQVLVDKKDPMFHHPTKPIGPFYFKEQAEILKKQGLHMVEDSGRGYRRVVPSPKPIKIIESETIKKLIENNIIVIAAGGGGIPVYKEGNKLYGIDAVIDKDLASACLASDIKADLLLILTGVKKVYLNYNKSNQKPITKMNVKEAKKYLKEGHFPEGSMSPKIQAAINFLEKGGKRIIITCPSCVDKALKGKEGTLIER